MNADVLTTRIADEIAVITPGSTKRMFLKLRITEPALPRMRSCDENKITLPSRCFEV